MILHINIEDLLEKRKIESNRIEFKKGWNPTKIYQSICAFANDFDNIGGGYILVGVEEENGIAKRPVCGVSPKELDKIMKAMIGYNNKLLPYYLPHPSVEEVDGKQVLAIWVPAGDSRPYEVRCDVTNPRSESKSYIRSGSSTIEAKGDPLNELREMANRVPFDDRGNKDISIKDISMILVQDYLRRVQSRLVDTVLTQDFSKTLEQLDLWTGPKEDRRLKNVAAMMFSEEPHKFFPYTQVDIVMFPEGVIKNPNNMIEAPSFKGSVPTIIRATLDYLRSNIVKERIIKPKNQAESIRYFNYPYQALEEAVVNALYHRDYQTREIVEIRVEPHEIAILSYSGPDRSISDADLKEAKHLKARRYRNRRLGDFLKELSLSEGRSTGIPTIQDELLRNGSPKARIDTDEERSFFLIHIPCHPDFVNEKIPLLPVNDRINDRIDNQIKEEKRRKRLQTMIQMIQQGKVTSAKQIAMELSISIPTVWRDIKILGKLEIKVNTRGKWTVSYTVA